MSVPCGTHVESGETKQSAGRQAADTVRSLKRAIESGLWRAAGASGASSDAAWKAGGSVKQAAADTGGMIVRRSR
jgi:hypothetical protein